MSEKGFLYVAAGDDSYLTEAVRSAESLRKVDPRARTCLISNNESLASAELTKVFDEHRLVEEPSPKNKTEGFLFKTKHMYSLSPFEKTIFVDTDTYFADSVNELFRILDYFDFCAAMGPKDYYYPIVDGQPLRGFQPYNTGVLGFNKSETCERVFHTWYSNFEGKIQNNTLRNGEGGQPSFNEAILSEDARICTLPNNYNARTPYTLSLKGKVKIIHDHHPAVAKMSKEINRTTRSRFWMPYDKRFFRRFPEKLRKKWRD